jgi:uncharacterized membrane protein YphA (DoxX/SURF4 family)
MRILHLIIRFFVGALFIFSGLIKVNDPAGTAIKLQEYFEVFAQDFGSFFNVFIPYALPIAVFVVVLEVVLGVAVFINFEMKKTTLVLLLLILFFSFLTFYSAYFEKVTDCGCFGDAIPLDPWQSFYKDVVLTIMIIWLFLFRRKYTPVFRKLTSLGIMTITVFLNLFLALYALAHLPFIDFRPYKIGDNIYLNMQFTAPPEYLYIMEKDGETKEFTTYPTDTTYTFVEMKRLNPETDPKITDYAVYDVDNQNVTEETFKGVKLLILIEKAEKTDLKGVEEIIELTEDLGKVELMVFTASSPNVFEEFRHQMQLAIPYYFVDSTVLKAMIRSNPGLILMRNGTVLGKWHYNDVPSAKEIRLLTNSN